MKNKVIYCKHNSKFCYSSEAKATRAVAKYEDIKRAYYCVHCDSWHTTSKEKIGAPIAPKVVERKEILKRIKQLINMKNILVIAYMICTFVVSSQSLRIEWSDGKGCIPADTLCITSNWQGNRNCDYDWQYSVNGVNNWSTVVDEDTPQKGSGNYGHSNKGWCFNPPNEQYYKRLVIRCNGKTYTSNVIRESVNCVLPVILEYFEYVGNSLRWKSSSEINFSHYVLEGSNDALIFIELEQIWGRNFPSTYSARSYGYLYYRLTLVDLNGRIKHSDIIVGAKDDYIKRYFTLDGRRISAEEMTPGNLYIENNKLVIAR